MEIETADSKREPPAVSIWVLVYGWLREQGVRVNPENTGNREFGFGECPMTHPLSILHAY